MATEDVFVETCSRLWYRTDSKSTRYAELSGRIKPGVETSRRTGIVRHSVRPSAWGHAEVEDTVNP